MVRAEPARAILPGAKRCTRTADYCSAPLARPLELAKISDPLADDGTTLLDASPEEFASARLVGTQRTERSVILRRDGELPERVLYWELHRPSRAGSQPWAQMAWEQVMATRIELGKYGFGRIA
jgi:hypothetical protein